MSNFSDYAAAIFPPIGTGVVFYLVMRFVMRADRNERLALQKLEEEEAAEKSAKEQPNM